MRQAVCDAADLPPGEMLATNLGPLPVLLVRTQDGDLHALINSCLHHGAKLSDGALLDRVTGGGPGVYCENTAEQVIRCPWHGYEYDVKTGCTVFDPNRRIQKFAAHEEGGKIIVENTARW